MIGFGGSPRASINLALAARTYAFIKRRGYVIRKMYVLLHMMSSGIVSD